MPEFFEVLAPAEARDLFLSHVEPLGEAATIPTAAALGRTLAEAVRAPHPLPTFPRSTRDGYAVRAANTFGASGALPAYLRVVGEVPMGQPATVSVGDGEAALVHTGGMIPPGADAVVMVEHTQAAAEGEIEILKAVAVGENVIPIGEDIAEGAVVMELGQWLRPQDVGGLLALGITTVAVARRPRVAIFATGDEVVPPDASIGPAQVRDINSTTVAELTKAAGGEPLTLGILPDDFEVSLAAVQKALADGADMLVLSAGSSVSVRDVTAEIFARLGEPGVLVHGMAIRPGKPTILAMAGRVPLVGLPGNPVSAMVVYGLVGVPVVRRLQGGEMRRAGTARARLAANIASVAGREDYVPARLVAREDGLWAEPVFGQSNLIFTLVRADGLVKIPLDKTGLEAGTEVEVRLF
jgi:molybdopterin molybdotransferase